MRILEVNVNIGVRGGAERYAEGVSEALRARGNRVQLLTLDGSRSVIGRQLRLLGFGAAYDVDDLRGQFDVVHLHNFYGRSPKLFRIGASAGMPLVWTVHDYRLLNARALGAPGLVSRAATLARIREASRADTTVFLSNFVRGIFRRHAGMDGPIVPMGIRGPELPSHTRAHDLDSTIVLGYLGRLTEKKGVRLLVESLQSAGRTDVKLEVAGDGPLLPWLQRASARSNWIKVLGVIDGAPKWRWLADLDALVVPSVWEENAPLVILEALEVGTPVLASAMGGIPEMAGMYGGIRAVQVGLWSRTVAELSKSTCARLRDAAQRDRPRTMDDVALDYENIFSGLLAK